MDELLRGPALAAPVNETPNARRLDVGASTPTHPDLIWFNATTGQTVSWTMSGANGTASNYLLQSPDWRLTFTADLDGDGQDDYIWENARSGQLAVWLMKGPAVTDASEIKVVLESPGWKVTHVADFNADGRDDLILVNESTGQTVMWLMNGTQVLESAVLLTDAGWRVVAAADLDGDDFADLVWEQRQTQAYSVWWMQGSNGKNAGTPESKSNGERVRMVAPTLGTSRSELLFENPDNPPRTVQALGVPLEYSTANYNWINRPGAPAVQGSQLSAVGDVSGNGRAAVIWRDTGSGATFISERLPGADSPDSFTTGTWRTEVLNRDGDWRVERTADLDGDGRADLIWRRTSTGQVAVSLMDGLQPRAESGLLTNHAWVVTGVRLTAKPPSARIKAERQVIAGKPSALDGRLSNLRGTGTPTYAWSLLSRPAGSQAALDDAQAAQPNFTPDIVGRYEVQLVVRVDGRSSKPARFLIDAGGAAPLGQVRVEPQWRAKGKAPNSVRLSLQLTDGLLANQSILVDVPAEFGAMDAWRPLSDGTQRFELSVQGRQLRLRLRERFVRFPAGSWITTDDLALTGITNPPQPGTYVFKIASDANPTPVSVPVRIAASDTPLDRAAFSFGSSVVGATTSFSLDVTSTSGLPEGSRLFVQLPDGYDASQARLVSATGAVDMDPPSPNGRATLVFNVKTSAAAAPGGRLRLADIQVEGIRNPICPYTPNNYYVIDPTPLLALKSTEDRMEAVLAVPEVVQGTTSVQQPTIVGQVDVHGAWAWSLRFVATKGLPEGGKVLMKLPPALTDWYFKSNMAYDRPPYMEFRCAPHRSVTIPKGAAVAPGGTFDSTLVQAFETIVPPPPGNYEFEVYTSMDSKPAKATLVVPQR